MAEIIKRAVIDNFAFDIEGRGALEIRVEKLTYLDGELIQRDHHRIGGIEADDDLDALLNSNSDNLEASGFGRIEPEGVDLAKGFAKLLRTKERVAAATARRQERETEARLEAEAAFEAARKREEDAAVAKQAEMREMFNAFMAEHQAKA